MKKYYFEVKGMVQGPVERGALDTSNPDLRICLLGTHDWFPLRELESETKSELESGLDSGWKSYFENVLDYAFENGGIEELKTSMEAEAEKAGIPITIIRSTASIVIPALRKEDTLLFHQLIFV